MKKLLFVSNEGSITGAPIFLAKLVRHLKIERPEYRIVIFFAKDGDLVASLSNDGFEVVVSNKIAQSNSVCRKIWSRLVHYYCYLKLILKFRPDLVYSNTIVNFGELVLAGLLRVPALLHMHEGRILSKQYRYRLKISSYFAKRVIVGSHYVNEVFRSITKRSGSVVYIGVEPPSEYLIRQKKDNTPLVIGMLGTICPNKGQIVAVKAMCILAAKGSFQLLIAGMIGDEDYYEQLCKFVRQHSLDEYVKFVGTVKNAKAFLSSLNLLLVASYDEALPTVILEAFSTATPVVASDVGGIPEIIQNGVSGLLVKSGDFEMLAYTIERVINEDALLEKLPLSALEVLRNKFNVSTNNLLIAKHLDDMLSK